MFNKTPSCIEQLGLATEFCTKEIPWNRLGRVNSEARNGTEWHEKIGFYKKSCPIKQYLQRVFVKLCFGTEFREFASIFPRNGIPSWFLFRGMVWNRFPSVCFYFCSTERNSELFSLQRNGSEQNSESLLLFLFHCTEFLAFFSSVEWFGTEFRESSVPRNSRNSAGTNQFLHFPCGIIFLSEIANPNWALA